MLIHTAHGVGRVVGEESTGRGRRQYRVAGDGWSVWVDAGKARVANEFGPAGGPVVDPSVAGAQMDPAAGGGAMPGQPQMMGGGADMSGFEAGQGGSPSSYQVQRQGRSRLAGDGEGPGSVDDLMFPPAKQSPAAGWLAEMDPEDRPGYGEGPSTAVCGECGGDLVDDGDGWEHAEDHGYAFSRYDAGHPGVPEDEWEPREARRQAGRHDQLVQELFDRWQSNPRAGTLGEGSRGDYGKYQFYGDTVHVPVSDVARITGISPDVIKDRRRYLRILEREDAARRQAGVVDGESTVLPWDPEPQYPSAVVPDEQTLQPGERRIDPGERLSPSDSVSGEPRSLPAGPDCFAPPKESRRRVGGGCPNHRIVEHWETGERYCPRCGYDQDEADAEAAYLDEEHYLDHLPEPPADREARRVARLRAMIGAAGDDSPVGRCQHCSVPIYDRDSGDRHQDGAAHLCWKCVKPHGVAMKKRSLREASAPARQAGGPSDEDDDDWVIDWSEGTDDDEDGTRHARLSDKYVRLEAAADHFGDPVQRFRDDPLGEVERVGSARVASAGEGDPRMREYVALVEHDAALRTAAWKDVRAKALRLRAEGKVHVNDVGEGRIYATVEGDHGTYETMIVKGGSLGKGAQSISNWHCGCLWGYWAFKRRYSYVGRLCSHGYAAYLEMQSRHRRENPQRRGPKGTWIKRYQPGEPNRRWAGRAVTAGVIADFRDFVNSNFDGAVSTLAWSQFAKEKGVDPSQWDQISGWFDKRPRTKRRSSLRVHAGGSWWDCPRCEQGNDLDADECQDCRYNRWDHDDPDVLVVHGRKLTYGPDRLVPETRDVPKGQGPRTVDVEEDERSSTGPDGVVGPTRNWFTDPVKHAVRRYFAGYYPEDDDFSEEFQFPRDESPWVEVKPGWTQDLSSEAEVYHHSSGGYVAPLSSGEGWKAQFSNDPDDYALVGSRDEAMNLVGQGRHAARKPTRGKWSDEDIAEGLADGYFVGPDGQEYRDDEEGLWADPRNRGSVSGLFSGEDTRNVVIPNYRREGRLASELDNDLVMAQGEEVEGIGQYQQFLDDARAEGDGQATGVIEEILSDEHDHVRELGEAMRQGAVDRHGPYDPAITSLSPMHYPSQFHVELPDASDEDLVMEMLRNRAPHGEVSDEDRDWDDEVVREFGRRGSAWFGQLAAAPEPAEAKAGDHLPFNGSGPADSLEFASSDEWTGDHEAAGLVDVTDLGDGNLIKSAGIICPKCNGWVDPCGTDDPHDESCDWRKPNWLAEDDDKEGRREAKLVDLADGEGDIVKYGEDRPQIERFAENLPNGWGGHPSDTDKPHEDFPLPPGVRPIVDGVQPIVDGVKKVLPKVPGIVDDALGDALAGAAKTGGAKSVRRIGGGLKAGSAPPRSFSDGDIAGAAKAFLRTAGRVYTPGEQRKLEEESHPLGARNLDGLELDGTHYLA